jgi:curved DNA-binding protein CbpA
VGGGDADDGEGLSKETDHYVVLGVTADATDKQIQQAYRMRSLKYHPDRKGGSTAAFQRIAQAFQTLSDGDKRANYDAGVDIKTRRGGGSDEDDSSDEDEERKQTLREEIERKYYPERYEYWPFGDPFINKRKREERKRRQTGQRQWWDED